MVPCKWCGRALHEQPILADGYPDRRPPCAAKETGGREVYNFHRNCWDSILRLHEIPPPPPQREASPQQQAPQQPQQPLPGRVPGLRPPGQR
jgi:hypothetical protein